nr:NUDIX hydrolase [Moritella viscosa]SHO18266.1 NUDIX hydrolase [Moritella viscosa]
MNESNIKSELKLHLDQYSSEYAIEKQYRKEMMTFLASSENPFYSNNVKGHFTASAWIVSSDLQHVLLTQHAKIGKWFQLGGHIEEFDKSFIGACLREAIEESGIQSLSLDDAFILDIDIHPIPEYKGIPQHPHYDISCYFVAPEGAKAVRTAESKQLKWVPIEQIKSLSDDAAINRMVEKTSLLINAL